jgi:hypothetical protein
MDRSGGIQGLVALAIACACGDVRQGDDESSSYGTAPTGKPDALDDGADDGSGSGESSTAADDDAGDDATKLDVGAGEASLTVGDEGTDESGCDKVDFLFVIDNSGSMQDEQENLITNFPGFISTIQETLDEAQDYHLMVIDSDRWVYEGCELFCGFGSCLPNPQYQCGVTVPFECEDILGAGVTYPRGAEASNTDCAFTSGARYMDTSEPDLAATFQCAARVGTGSMGGAEKPMEAIVNAVTPSTEAFACNEGFLRDDAILVVTFITDEDDNAGDGSGGTVAGWKQALVAAKGGDESAIVVLGLFGDNDQPGAICPPLDPNNGGGAEPSLRLRQFVESFGDHGVAGSVCAASYQQFFLDAVDVIDTTCEDFVPPG